MAVYDDSGSGAVRAGQLVNYTGALVSLALMAGVGVWGYKLVVRDVSGIPVVRAVQGDMRVAPSNPGGDVALHTGLSVNEVAAVGEAAAPEDTLLLAPRTSELAEEDLAVQSTAEASEIVPDTVIDAETEVALTSPDAVQDQDASPLNAEEILALADRISAGAVPLTDLAEGENIAPTTSVSGGIVVIDQSIPGVKSSLHPVVRPLGLEVAAAALSNTSATPAAVVASAPSSEVAVSTATFPAGTNLVQLGAFPTPDVAADAWGKLNGEFSDYMTGRDRIIQIAQSSGRTFYRLRATGFEDLADARRFCAALDAGNAECIPVVVR